ncbi:MAG: hypothetical protein OXN89_11600 [Bryobacterales bacterium]|nr:hypothetical protein [Bryobacterales bacterium]
MGPNGGPEWRLWIREVGVRESKSAIDLEKGRKFWTLQAPERRRHLRSGALDGPDEIHAVAGFGSFPKHLWFD